MTTSGSVALIPERPAENGYWKNDYRHVADQLIKRLLTLRKETEGGWQDVGSVENTQCYIYPKAANEPLSTLPMFMGKTRVEGLTPLEVFSGIRVTGFRMMWDVRVQSAHIMRAFSQHEFLFYLIWRGIGPIYNPRDVAGIQTVHCCDQNGLQQTSPDFTTSSIILGYQGLDDIPGVPAAVEGCIRARLNTAAYYIEQRDGGCDLTYIGHVDLASAIPAYIMTTLTKELPKCTARLRDALGTFGVPPVLIDRQSRLAIQYLACNPETRQITLFATVLQQGSVHLYLDFKKMFTKGVVITNILGSAATAVSVRENFTTEDGQPRRMLALDLLSDGIGGDFRLTIDAADKEGPDSGTGPGWW